MVYLMMQRAFFPLFLTQFLSAFNDNAFKLAMLTLISYYLAESQHHSEHYQVIAGALFILPFFLFSATAGQLADKYDKAKMTQIIKVFEVVLISVGSVSFYFGLIPLMLFTLAGMGVHSTFFGPIKYSILPDHLPPKQLLGATALVEGSTYLAILLGTILGALSIKGTGAGSADAILITGLAAVVGAIASFFIPKAPPSALDFKVDWYIWRATYRMFKDVVHSKQMLIVIVSISWFWLIGSVILTKLPDYTRYVLHAQQGVFALFLALFSIGIASGSFIVSYLLKGKVVLRYTPYALMVLAVFSCDLYWATPAVVSVGPLQSVSVFLSNPAQLRIAADLFLLALSGGFFVVPLYTYLQIASKGEVRARTIASNNIINALFMVIGALSVMFLLYLQAPIAFVFLILGLASPLIAVLLWKEF